ncbi:CcdC family protein [Paenibacillus chibensis]|uniref:CcdC family protein n=1 Tax=Paenibacillus chibensis TaxID=59846 RepID=UPI000FD9C59B|nr:cytochrome c biogenesis protein CcdC [Paenibacillus chibensis]MEC0372885.1 cytochrome c biogenesis protein CcdC [Paenibacillus chibensis]
MAHISPSYLQIGSTVGALVMALLVIFVRLKASNRPVTIKKIIIPPLGMSTGFLMFVAPQVRVPWLWALLAFLIGWFIFSYPLIRSTKFEVSEGQVFARRSKSFVVILFALLIVRTVLHQVIDEYVSIPQSGALFFLLAFGMILHWRVFMLKQYRVIEASGELNGTPLHPEVPHQPDAK